MVNGCKVMTQDTLYKISYKRSSIKTETLLVYLSFYNEDTRGKDEGLTLILKLTKT